MIDTIQMVWGDPKESYRILLKTNITYAKRETGDLKMQLMTPNFKLTGKRYPTVIFLNAGGFRRPDTFEELPQLVDLARAGYVIASIDHRGVDRDGEIQDHAKFPDSIADLKEAIRFLRAHAEEYGVDSDRIALMGSAPGGWIALMAAFTVGDKRYDIGEYLDYSSEVQAVIDIYGQTDYTTLARDRLMMPNYTKRDVVDGKYPIEMTRLFGQPDEHYEEYMRITSPVTYVTEENKIPPVLLLHDEFNHVIPFMQSVTLFEKMRACGKRVEMYKVAGIGWLSGFWTEEVIQIIKKFLDTCS